MKTRAAVLRKAGTPVYAGDVRVGHVAVVFGTKKYALDEINDGYQDLMDGKNIRGVVVHSGS